MLVLEVSANPNCEPMDLRVFEDLDAPRLVTHVRLERAAGHPAWYEVVGWTAAGFARLRLRKSSDAAAGCATACTSPTADAEDSGTLSSKCCSRHRVPSSTAQCSGSASR